MFIKTFTLLFLCFFTIGLSQGAENDANVAEATPLLESTSENVVEPLNSAEDKVIQSPIVGQEDKHGQLFRYAYDAEHLLFPVKIISIDSWLVTDFVVIETRIEPSSEEASTGTSVDVKSNALEILLAPGEHQMKVIPDFENIQPQTVFMDSPWQEKHITFNLIEGQQIAVAARLLNVDTIEWTLELYRVEIPIEVEPEFEPDVPETTDTLTTKLQLDQFL